MAKQPTSVETLCTYGEQDNRGVLLVLCNGIVLVSLSRLSLLQTAHQSGEEECTIAVMGNVYIIDLATMQQVCTYT